MKDNMEVINPKVAAATREGTEDNTELLSNVDEQKAFVDFLTDLEKENKKLDNDIDGEYKKMAIISYTASMLQNSGVINGDIIKGIMNGQPFANSYLKAIAQVAAQLAHDTKKVTEEDSVVDES